MSITKHIHHQGHIDDLIARRPALEKFKHSTIREHSNFKWRNTRTNTLSWQAVVSFFGKSGYGKSSTVNAFLGEPILKTSDVSACTNRCDCLDFKITDDYFLSFADYPGIGESEYKDKEYIEMYKEFKGIKTAQLKTAVELDSETKAEFTALLTQQTQKSIELVEEINPNIIGGFVVTIDDKQADSSISTKIQRLRKEFDKNIYAKGF